MCVELSFYDNGDSVRAALERSINSTINDKYQKTAQIVHHNRVTEQKRQSKSLERTNRYEFRNNVVGILHAWRWPFVRRLVTYCPLHALVQSNFRRYYLARSSSNSTRSLEGFRPTLVKNFIKIRQRVENFPIDPHCKTNYNWGIWGNSSSVVESILISPQSSSKTLKWSRRIWAWSDKK